MDSREADLGSSQTGFLGSESAPLVHTLETTRHSPLQPNQRSSRAKSQVSRQASAVELYKYLEYYPDSDKLTALKRCRKIGYFVRHKETGRVRLALNNCKLRWCALCGSAKVSWITFTVSGWLANRHRPKFATFTLKHTDEDLGFQIQQLYRFFVNLRKLAGFRSKVRGGIWFFQIKLSVNDGLWHNHLHCVIDSSYFPQGELSSFWSRITEGSTVVDIRIIQDPDKAANEVARYAACPCDLSKNSLEQNREIYHALHSRRICGAWGTAKGVQLKPPKDEQPDLWENVGSRSVVVELRNSDPCARAIYQAYVQHTYLEPDVNCRSFDNWLDDDFQNYLAEKESSW